jgi:D-glycero-alpha-D-manno-heptose-7-phosphate kinase
MIGVRVPFRLSFVGGGSDLAAFYERSPGKVISTTINQYVYIMVHRFFDHRIQVKYSRTELVEAFEDVQHPIVREVLRMFNVTGVDINSIADIPSGTGLGSSSAFTVGLLLAMSHYLGRLMPKAELARLACEIEIDKLGEPIGKQDQYASTMGGLNEIGFAANGSVSVEPLVVDRERVEVLEKHLVLFYLGWQRRADEVLVEQKRGIQNDVARFECQKRMVELVDPFKAALCAGDMRACGEILDANWQLKRTMANAISSNSIDEYYARGVQAGAYGGKLLGAGGGGFLAFLCAPQRRQALMDSLPDLRHFPVRLEHGGATTFYYDGR